jgi:hypothetical protein
MKRCLFVLIVFSCFAGQILPQNHQNCKTARFSIHPNLRRVATRYRFSPSNEFPERRSGVVESLAMASAELLIGAGFLPSELPPPFTSRGYSRILAGLPNDLDTIGPKSSRCAFHSIPRFQHVRRLLSIPNPLHQLKLAQLVERSWSALDDHMRQSPLSLTRLEPNSNPPRALKKVAGFRDLETARISCCSAARYVLKADLSRFYHTLYTHSIPWALHTKTIAKAQRNDRTLIGNLLDEAVRNTQDQQTLGIPVGPDTSDLISEVLGVALDLHLLEKHSLKGVRFVDDYYLYFSTRSEAESALADLHTAANHFAVEINPLKTMIKELPESLLPTWKVEFRLHEIRESQEKVDLLSLFSSAFEHAAKYPGNNVLKYAVKQSTSKQISAENWELYQSLLLGSLVWEPSLAPTLAPILAKYSSVGYSIDSARVQESLSEVALYHAKLRQGFEVAWALWLSKLFAVKLSEEVLAEISLVDDSVVALLALDLKTSGLADAIDTTLWSSHIRSDQLFSENWLLAYEAFVKGWLPSADGSDIRTDQFFGLLAAYGVEFYDTGTREPAGETDWLAGY